MKKTILVTGGAGYIGSAVVKELLRLDYEVVVVDNLSKGRKELLDEKAIFFELDLIDRPSLKKVFQNYNFDAVIHLAAYKAVAESMDNAVKYSDNISGTINLLSLMVEFRVSKIVYSSTAAVYASSDNLLTEESALKPENYYGFTKLKCEEIIQWYSRIHDLKHVILRYFNVAGDAGLNYVNPEAENIFPIIMDVLFGKRKKLFVFGKDYDTVDGTGVRDYIDINDLVKAHLLALDSEHNKTINLGCSKGYSVLELIKCAEEVSGKKVPFEIVGRRAGDLPLVIASNDKAGKILGWKPENSLFDMMKSTYNAYKFFLS